jgi:hypothetical protein
MCIWLRKKEKYENKQRRNYDYNFKSNKRICTKKRMFLKMGKITDTKVIKKFKWHLNISIMMLLYSQNWKIT